MPKHDCHNSDTFLPEEAGFPAGLSPAGEGRRPEHAGRPAHGRRMTDRERAGEDGNAFRRLFRTSTGCKGDVAPAPEGRRRAFSGAAPCGQTPSPGEVPRRKGRSARMTMNDRAAGRPWGSRPKPKKRKGKAEQRPPDGNAILRHSPGAENPFRRGGKTLQAAAR